eukprot:TRINITY_DN3907_c1_g1_i3.p1 TRINITY_DN3907_c1_g1~~TRINITY_DN3907_c1_g1_i3.p1  ORF type:complete len:122 (-),score=28.88 TRINITY_DN3907_c1_g1_i3:130-495(-)
MSEHSMTRQITNPIENIEGTDAEINLTTLVNKSEITQKEQSHKGTIGDPSNGNTEKATGNHDYVTERSQTTDSRLTASAKNMVTSRPFSEHSSTFSLENELENTVEINSFMPKNDFFKDKD